MALVAACMWWLLLVCARCDEVAKSSWADLEVVSKIAKSMPYKHFKLDIYELRSNSTPLSGRKTYAYVPTVELDHASARSQYNDVTGRYETLFRVIFWTEPLERRVLAFLRQSDPSVESSDVSVIGFNKMMLSSSQPSSLYTLSHQWDNYRKEQHFTFRLFCEARANCDRLAHLMRTAPELFAHLRMQFTVSSKTSRTRAVRITAEAIASSAFFSHLRQALAGDEVYLTADDTNRLLSESVANLAVEMVDDTGLISPHSAAYQELRQLLVQDVLDAGDVDRVPWQSVFWNEDNYRPDKSSAWINQVYRKSDNESRQLMRALVASEKEVDWARDAGAQGKLGSNKVSFTLQSGFRHQGGETNQQEKDEALKRLAETKSYVQWTGEAFQPKPIKLWRINLAVGRKSRQFSEVTTSITYATVGLTLGVCIADGGQGAWPQDKARAGDSNVTGRRATLRPCPTTIGKGSSCYATISPAGCYCFVWSKMTWSEANDLCARHDMQLVSIESAEENEQLVRLYDTSSYAGYSRYYLWTSGSDQEAEGHWVWTGTGQPIAYSKWADGEPNSKRWGNFLQIRYVRGDFVWNDAADVPQSWRHAFPLCELNALPTQLDELVTAQAAQLANLQSHVDVLTDKVASLASSLKDMEARMAEMQRDPLPRA